MSSINFDIINDDLTMRNYLALYVCIMNPKIKYLEALRLFEINRKSDNEI